jgi:hypothetical protein
MTCDVSPRGFAASDVRGEQVWVYREVCGRERMTGQSATQR